MSWFKPKEIPEVSKSEHFETTESVSLLNLEGDRVFNDVAKAVATTGYLTYEQERKIIRKIDLRLLPLLILLYLCKNLDVNNISYVKIMNKGEPTNILNQLHMVSNDWAWNSTIYYIPFIIFEIPSTLLFKKSTPRVHQFRIAFLWGATIACHAAVKNKQGIYALRALLGFFEAGMFPAALAQLTYWYRPDEITVRMAVLGVLGSFSSVLTAFITYGFSFADGRRGLSGWQWVFLIEGIFSMVCAFLLLFFLPNFPDTAKWLTEEERAYVVARLPRNSPKGTDETFNKTQFIAAFTNPVMWVFTFLKLFSGLGTYGLSFWLPSIVQSFGFTSDVTSPLLSIPSSAISVMSGIGFSYLADRAYFHPGLIVGSSLVITLACFIVLTVVTSKAALYAFIIIASASSAADGSILSSWMVPSFEGSTGVGLCFAFSNSIGQLGGIIGPQIFRSKYAPRYTIPYAVCLIFIGLAIITLAIAYFITRNSERNQRSRRREYLKKKSQLSKNDKPVYVDGVGGEILERE